MRTISTILIVIVIFLIGWILLAVSMFIFRTSGAAQNISSWVIMIGILFMLYKFVRTGFKEVPANPPHKGILLFWKRRQKVLLKEGLHFFPLYPFLFGFVPVKVEKVNQNLSEQILRTPDRAEIGVTVSITWTPGFSDSQATEEDQVTSLINFLNSGGEIGVTNILEDICKDRLRGWAFSGEEGPADWEEATKSRDAAIAVLIKAVLGGELEPISSEVPTPILLKYFNVPKQRPSKYEEARWGKKSEEGPMWEGLEEELSSLSGEELKELGDQVRKRRSVIEKVRQGNGFFKNSSLGITINKFTLNEIILKGELAKAAEMAAKEDQERLGEMVELAHVLERVQEVRKILGVSAEQALELVQTERNKVVKTIHEGKLNVSPETREVIEKMFPGVLKSLFKL